MLHVFGDRKIAIVRELTKIHEQVIRTTLSEAVREYGDGSLKGEIVLVVAGAEPTEEEQDTLESAVQLARRLMDGGISASAAAKEAAKLTGFKKGEIYRKLLDNNS